jgi:hypothetical protein
VISALAIKTAPVPRNSAAALRVICRAIIRRVRDEHPDSTGYELFLRYWAASPFASDDDLMQYVFQEEVFRAVGQLRECGTADLVAEEDLYADAASSFIQ